jgi:hypothetical protein
MEEELCVEHPVLASNALARLGAKLAEIGRVLPDHSLRLLQARKLFLMSGELSRQEGRNNGADYFQPSAPEHFPQLDPRMASSILIYSASNYVWLSDLWARKVLVHEFAHAWQLEQWPEKQETILSAYEHAKEKGLHRQVLGDDGKPLETAYAIANQLEYFAELSCMYFNCCDYFPRNRQELQAYDPVGYAMIRQMWQIAAQ